jgi:hypothetical protein
MGVLADMRAMGGAIRTRVTYLLQVARRLSAGPAFMRLTAASGAMVAACAAVPTNLLLSPRISAALPVALGVAGWPRTRWVGLTGLAVLGTWVLTTVGFGEPITPGRLIVISSGLYTMHAAAAMASVLPYDAVVAPAVLVRWAARTAAVAVASLTLGLGGLIIVSRLHAAQTLAAPIAGAVVAAALVGMLAWLLWRK